MSQNKKPSLWQKIKQLLSTSAHQLAAAIIESTPEPLTPSTTEPPVNSTDAAQITESAPDIAMNHPPTHDDDPDTYDTSDTPIIDCLKAYLHHQHWHYTYYRPTPHDSQHSHHLSLRMRNKDLECGYLFRVQEDNALLAVYGILPFLIPESHQSAAMLLITQINYDMLIGNIEMDISDGEIRYKNAIDVEAVGIDDAIIEHLLQSVVVMTTVTYELFSDLIHTEQPSADMSNLLDELREQADSRTFFLPTDFVQ